MPILGDGSRGPCRHRAPDRGAQLRPAARRLAPTRRAGPGRGAGRPDPAARPRRGASAADAAARGTPDQVLVTAGGVHGIHLALTVLTGPGDRVLVEHPTYPNAIGAVTAQGARPVPVPMTPGPDGSSSWDLDLLTSAVRDAAPRLAYVIPDFQNPTGALLGGEDRTRLVELARRTSTTLLVDETLIDLALDGQTV